MKTRMLVLGAAAMLAANTANATVYFDSVDVTNPTANMDGVVSDNVFVMADSFYAATPDFSQVSVLLSADTPSDGGSSMLYLVPNTGGTPGAGGSPTFATSAGNFAGFTGAELIGGIADSSLAATGAGATLVTFNFSPALAAALTTANNEYWIALVGSSDSSVEFYYGADTSGVGEANQFNFYAINDAGGGGYGLVNNEGSAVTSQPYDLIVTTPEPASLAVLGGALASLGYFRRRTDRKA